jgi:ketosteroid isomerase-like protein
MNADTYRTAGDLAWVSGNYTIVTRAKCGGGPCTQTGVFQTMFEKQADGSWKVSTHTMIPRPK